MKVLMISTDFPYKSKDGTIIQGGGSACILQLVEGLLKKGFAVAVVTRKEKDSAGELTSIPIYRSSFLYLGFRESKITHSLFSVKEMLKAINEFKPDIIHSHNPPAALTGIIGAKYANKPHVLTMHGPWSDVRLSGIKKSLAQVIERTALKSVKGTTCDSLALAKMLAERYNVKTVGIQNAVDEDYFEKIPKETAKKALVVKTDDKIVLFTGRFVSEKGLDTLLLAAEKVLAKRNEVTFLLIGGGFDEKLVHEWLAKHPEHKEKIKTIPFLPHEKMKYAYALADVFVLPSLAEGLSRSLMEAMLFGLPCIATNVGGNTELIENKRGVLVPPRNSEALSQAINKVLDDSVFAKNIGKEAQAYIINNLTVERRVGKFIEFYRSVV